MKTFLFRPLQLCSSTGMDPLMKTIREVSLVFPIRKSAVAAGDGSIFYDSSFPYVDETHSPAISICSN